MTDWTVRRWARYGQERLYAQTPGGTALGYLDLKTGQYHSDDLSNLPLLEKALAQHLASIESGRAAALPVTPAPTPSETSVEIPDPEPPHGPPTWEDLSAAQAGAAARERALAEREAQGWFRHGLSRLVGARTDERAWRIGADGEQAVAEQLGRLGPQWRLLHAVPVGDRGSDIDHVVIGPAGVFTVNAKHHPHTSVWVGGDTFMVNGQRVPYIRNSRHEARRASRLLTQQAGFPVVALGVIAVMGAHKGFTVKKQPEDGRVVVVRRKRISQYLHGLPAQLSAREIDAVFEVARRSTTWRP
ncbi:nuclease-related domain-containing protein [Ornithinimicrobium sediminis]|uniref:nuclease-related domain-containing protein n=1 Tax=Ornithinimicrobium sediminis TaxID=2904603 RepID=UPI001E3313D2|nr:nuclease-related domain-containing protein [Ornithinimicrobium sediminis]MCE0485450.1 NERD domain-containing protein [Ornithinimicrobium sediminis]